MAIETNAEGFITARMDAVDCSQLHARLSPTKDAFEVVTDEDHFDTTNGWFYSEDACREAAEFFLKLADELNRRNKDNA